MTAQKKLGKCGLRLLRQKQLFEECDADLEAFNAEPQNFPTDTSVWTLDDAKACANRIRRFHDILHRHGYCTRDKDCLSCRALAARVGAVL